MGGKTGRLSLHSDFVNWSMYNDNRSRRLGGLKGDWSRGGSTNIRVFVIGDNHPSDLLVQMNQKAIVKVRWKSYIGMSCPDGICVRKDEIPAMNPSKDVNRLETIGVSGEDHGKIQHIGW